MSEQQRTGADGWWLWGFTADVPHLLTHAKVVDGRVVVDRLVISAPDITAATLRSIGLRSQVAFAGQLAQSGWPADDREECRALEAAIDAFPIPVNRPPENAEPRPPLTRPDGSDPEGFSRRVADAYNEAVKVTKTPAKALADEAGVPVTTVHRWVRDARRLGLLGPARKGRAG
ncbi:hypothetical protein [Micromonospora sp. NBC_01813]|uniref:hypothetical protein n=1 Tax=Micromonospora sp. NBC_01813 TaxID=2975988 RepID=UPI002DDB5F54|nr:hypothetical protein [Micromonospora sp. NBC_01813]WSA07074.1 hypothetical protein OG958_22800 [Micromonospora sp. NBC_01813]